MEVMSALTYNPLFLKLIDDEFYTLLTYITSLDETSQKYYGEYAKQLNVPNWDLPLVSMEDIFKNMFKLVI